MTRVLTVLVGVVLLPAAAAAQAVPVPSPVPAPAAVPAPPAPVVAPAPTVPPCPAVAPTAPLPPLRVSPDPERLWELEDHLWELQSRPFDFKYADIEAKVLEAQEKAFATQEKVFAAQEKALAAVNKNLNFNVEMPDFDFRFEPMALQGPAIVRGRGGDGDERGAYNNGLNALQNRQYDRAIVQFDRVIAVKGAYADAATYWKAFSQARLVRTDEALATLGALRRDYPQSRYLAEAKVLEADVRRLAGQRVDPQTLDANDEIKLIAINGIANTDPDRAIPLLEGVLNGANTLGNKRRALFVLALSKDPRAHQILLRYAKGGGSPELQMEAIRNLVSRRDNTTNDAELREIYESVQDAAVRRAVIDAYGNAGNKMALITIAKSRTETIDNRRSAVSRLNDLATPAELWSLYQGETDPELRMQIINVFGSMSARDELLQAVKTEKDPKVRLRALRSLGSLSSEQTGTTLVDLYGSEQDRDAKRSIIGALRGQKNAEALVAIARKETTLDLKREIVSAISDMAGRDKVAADYLMEMIK